jgi:hypothetical protein
MRLLICRTLGPSSALFLFLIVCKVRKPERLQPLCQDCMAQVTVLVNQACWIAAAGSRQCARMATMRSRLSSVVSLLDILVCRVFVFRLLGGPDLAIPAGCMLFWTHLSIVSSHSIAFVALLRCVFVCTVRVCVRVCAPECVHVCLFVRERNEHCLHSLSAWRVQGANVHTHTRHIYNTARHGQASSFCASRILFNIHFFVVA